MSDKPTRIRKGVEFWPQSEQQTAPWRAISAVFRASQTGLRHEFVTAASGRVFSPAQRDTLATRSSEKKTRQAKLGLLHDEPTRVRKASNLASKWQKPAPLRSISQPSEHRQPVGGMNSSQQQAAASVRRRNAKRSPHARSSEFHPPKDAPHGTHSIAPCLRDQHVPRASHSPHIVSRLHL